MAITILLLVAFFAVTITVGIIFRKRATDVSGFVLGGRSLGPWLAALTYGTSYFSAVIFVGYAGQFGWRFGLSSTWIGIGNALVGSLLAWVVLGRRTMIMTKHLGSSTMPEFFGERYGSKNLKVIASVIIFIFLVPYTASLYNGLSRLFAIAFNVDYVLCIILMSELTAIYVITGGYFASTVNDFIQGIIMLIGIVSVIAAVLKTGGGFTASLAALSKVEDLSVSSNPGIFASFFGPDPLALLGVILLTSLGTWGMPQMVQRFYTISSEKAIVKGTVISTVFAIIIAGGCYLLGGFGRLFSTPGEVAAQGFDSIIPSMVSTFSPAMIGLVILLVMAASMSTLSSLVMTSASTLTLDFLKTTVAKNMDDKRKLLVIRIFVFVFIAISATIAIIQYRGNVTFIAQLMGISWGSLAGSFLAPFLYGLYWRRTSKNAVWFMFFFSTVFMLSNMFFKSSFPVILQSSINAGAFCMILGLVAVPVISLLSPAPDKERVNRCFSCYEK